MPVRHGGHIWREWLDICNLNDCPVIAMFDHHGVVDTLDDETAIGTGVALSHLDIPSILCSYGAAHVFAALNPNTEYHPFISELDGAIFTDVREHRFHDCDVYRPPGYPEWAIRIGGDKGCVNRLLGRPGILIDDRSQHVEVHLEAHPGNRAVLFSAYGRAYSQRRDVMLCHYADE